MRQPRPVSHSCNAPSRRCARHPGVVLAVLLGLAGIGLAGCQRAPAADPKAAGSAPPALEVGVIEARRQAVPLVLEAVGRAEGSREVEIRARVTGILEKQVFREGEAVRAGAPMYRIDRAPFEIALAQANAALEQSRARLERSRIEAARLEQLVRAHAISQREFDDASAALRENQASLLAAKAKVSDAQLSLSYTQVNAPIGGVAGRSLRSEGSLVTAGSDSSLLTTVVRTDPIWVRFSLAEQEFARLRNSAGDGKVSLVMADGTAFAGSGRLNFAGSTVDVKLGTVQLRAEFPNPGLTLLPGQFVRAMVDAGQQEGVLVPQAAVLRGDQGNFVWIIDAQGKAQQRQVATGGWAGPDWVVGSGLQSGDKVIVDNLLKLRPGAAVQPRTPPPASGAAASEPAGGAGPKH